MKFKFQTHNIHSSLIVNWFVRSLIWHSFCANQFLFSCRDFIWRVANFLALSLNFVWWNWFGFFAFWYTTIMILIWLVLAFSLLLVIVTKQSFKFLRYTLRILLISQLIFRRLLFIFLFLARHQTSPLITHCFHELSLSHFGIALLCYWSLFLHVYRVSANRFFKFDP